MGFCLHSLDFVHYEVTSIRMFLQGFMAKTFLFPTKIIRPSGVLFYAHFSAFQLYCGYKPV